jgi:hypothetical protein
MAPEPQPDPDLKHAPVIEQPHDFAASTQPPSPCECNAAVLDNGCCDGCGKRIVGTGKQSPAEPQGDVEVGLATPLDLTGLRDYPVYDALRLPGGEPLWLEGCGIVNRGPEQVLLAAKRNPRDVDDLEPRQLVAITRHQAQALTAQGRLHGASDA